MKSTIKIFIFFYFVSIIDVCIAQKLTISEINNASESSTLEIKKLSVGKNSLKDQSIKVISVQPLGYDIFMLQIEPFTPFKKNKEGQELQFMDKASNFFETSISPKDKKGKLFVVEQYDKYIDLNNMNVDVIIKSISHISTHKKTAVVKGGIMTFKDNCIMLIECDDDKFIIEFPAGFTAGFYCDQIIPLEGSMTYHYINKKIVIGYHKGEVTDSIVEPLLPLKNKALVYIIGDSTNICSNNVYCDEKYLGSVNPNSGLYKFLDSSTHQVSCKTEFDFYVKPGEIYYIEIKRVGYYGEVTIRSLNEIEGKNRIKSCRLDKDFIRIHNIY